MPGGMALIANVAGHHAQRSTAPVSAASRTLQHP